MPKGRSNNVQPTENQKAVFDKVVKQVRKGQKVSVSKAMRESGYSKNVAAKPNKVTKSAGWQTLLDKYLPEDFLEKKHRELLNKTVVHAGFDKEAGHFVIEKSKEMDVQAVKAGLDMAYKLRGKYKETLDVNHKGLSLKDLYEASKEKPKEVTPPVKTKT